AKSILTEHADKVHLIAGTLLERETLDIDMIKQLIDNGKIEEKPEPEQGGSTEPVGGSASAKTEAEHVADAMGDEAKTKDAKDATAKDAPAKDSAAKPTAAPGMTEDVKVNIQPQTEQHESNKLGFERDEDDKKEDK